MRNYEIKTDVYFLYFTESKFQTYNFYKNINNDYLFDIDGHQHHQKSICWLTIFFLIYNLNIIIHRKFFM